MKYTIEQAPKGGWAVFQQENHSDQLELLATGSNLEDAVTTIAAPHLGSHSIDTWARMIVACSTSAPYRSPPKISMIKLLRTITGCGLREGKEAIEACL